MALKIIEWNIKGSAALPWKNGYKIPSEVVRKIMAQDADIIVLSEFCVSSGWDYFQEQLMGKYIWFMNYSTGKNGLLICVKSQLVDLEVLNNTIYDGNSVFVNHKGCNILQITLPLHGGKTITVLGCRVEVDICHPGVSQEDYDARRRAFHDCLIPAVKQRLSSDIYVVCGDFNNAYCRGDLRRKFDPEKYKELPQCNYNLNIIKDTFDSMGFIMTDVDESGNSVPTFQGYVPNDHIFVRGLKTRSCKVVPTGDLSDHDMILAEVD